MKKDRTRACNREFTQNGVTPCHFVTSEAGCDDPTRDSASPTKPTLVVNRCYRPEPEVLDALVEALHALLVDASGTEPATESEPPELACFSSAPE